MKQMLYIIVMVLAISFCVACRHEPASDPSVTDSVSAGKYIMVEEGPQLEYFEDYERCIAYTENGEAESWMLRTVALSDGSTVFGVSVDGVIGMGGINGPNGPYENNIRPAFCLPADTPITLSQDIIDGQEVYIIMY